MALFHSPKTLTDGLVFMYDTGNKKSYPGEPVVNIWSEQYGGDVNLRGSWQKPKAYNGEITESVYTGGTWSGNRIWEVLHTAGTSGYGGYESWRLCVNQPLAGSYSSTRRVAIKICILEGSISDLSIHSGGGNAAHNSSYFTAIPESQVPRDCPIKSGWYQFLAPANWTSTAVGHCVGLGFITYNRVKILTAEPMYYPSDHLIPFSGTERTTTQGLIDRTGNETIDLSNVSFDSNAQMTFDGTDDYIDLGDLGLGSGPFTVEAVIYPTLASTYHVFFRKGDSSTSNDNMDWSMGYDYNQFHVRTQNASVSINEYAGANFVNNYGHVTLTYNGSTIRMYVNGSEVSNKTVTLANNYSNYSIGRGINNYAQLDVNTLKVYNQALTSTEVTKNFNAIRSRFGL